MFKHICKSLILFSLVFQIIIEMVTSFLGVKNCFLKNYLLCIQLDVLIFILIHTNSKIELYFINRLEFFYYITAVSHFFLRKTIDISDII